MPKLQRSEEQIKQSLLAGTIKKYQEVEQLPVAKLALRTGIPASTLYQKMREPWRFTHADLCRIFRVLHVPSKEIVKCFPIKEDTA